MVADQYHIDFSKYSLPFRELSTFFFFILLGDNAAKYLLIPAMTSLNATLGPDWMVTLLVQTSGLALFGLLLIYVARPKTDTLVMPCIFLVVILIAAPLLSSFQDFSPDGQKYHLERVALFPVDWHIDNMLLSNARGPSIYYPLLTDDIRGLQVTILGSGPFSGVAVNIAFALCGIYFWTRHCSFLPLAVRWIPAFNTVITTQLLTYYVDGFIAVVGGMLFLACMLTCIFMQKNISIITNVRRDIVISMSVGLLVIMQCKFSFSFLFVSFASPLLAIALIRLASRDVRFVSILNYLRADSMLLCAIGCLFLIILANPYLLVIKSIIYKDISYSYFSYATLKQMGDYVFNGHVLGVEGLKDVPALFRFFRSNILSLWPGGASFVDDDINSLFALSRRLVARIGTEDARFSGFGPFSTFVFVYAFIFSVKEIWKIITTGVEQQNSNIEGKYDYFKTMISVTFVIQLVISIIYPLGWWARMNPAIYFSASIIALFSLCRMLEKYRQDNAYKTGSAYRFVALLCIFVIAGSAIAPPFVHLLRSKSRMSDFAEAVQEVRDKAGPSMSTTVLFPIYGQNGMSNMPSNPGDYAPFCSSQLSAAVKFLQVSRGDLLRVNMIPAETCKGFIMKVDSVPSFCVCRE